MDIPEMQQLYMKHKDAISKLTNPVAVEAEEIEEPKEMTQGIDLQSLVMPRGGDGMGLGGGLIGGVLLGALLGRGRGGLLGGGEGGDSSCLAANLVTKDDLTLQTLGDVKASIPYNEAQMQLALAQAVASLTNQNTSNTQYLSNQNVALANQATTNQALLTRDVAAVDTNVDRQSCAIQNVVHAEGEATRALITSNLIAQLQAEKVILANEVSELRNDCERQSDRHGVEVTMINNQNQNQLQFQQQAQALNSLVGVLGTAIQNIRSTNSAINVGGTQLASPTNTNTNIH